VAEQINEFLMKNHETCQNGYASFSKVNATIFLIHIFMVIVVALVVVVVMLRGHSCRHGYKENFKETYHQKWNNNVKMEKKKVKIMVNKMKI